MTATDGAKKKLALVYGTLPTVEEIDQFLLLAPEYDVTVVTSESIVGYLTQTSHFDHLALIPLPDHSENGRQSEVAQPLPTDRLGRQSDAFARRRYHAHAHHPYRSGQCR